MAGGHAQRLPAYTNGVDSTLHRARSACPAEAREPVTNGLERIMKEIRRRTRVVGSFPDGQSALMLAAARLRHIAGTKWGERRYLDMTRLKGSKTRRAG